MKLQNKQIKNNRNAIEIKLVSFYIQVYLFTSYLFHVVFLSSNRSIKLGNYLRSKLFVPPPARPARSGNRSCKKRREHEHVCAAQHRFHGAEVRVPDR